MIHGDPIVNVSVINGRPMWTFNFKLTPPILALRVCKPEGGRHIVTCLGVKEFSWPKDLSGGLEVTKQTVGLDEAQPMVQVPSHKKGSLVKPNFLQVKSDAQSTWVIGESSRGNMCGDSESPESAATHLELSASALNVDLVRASVAS